MDVFEAIRTRRTIKEFTGEAISREELERRFDQYESKFDGEDIPLPPFWGGYTIRADRVEYWEGRPSRMHERVVLTRSEEGWDLGRLYP